MGGYGSGRWGSSKPHRKRIVESCLILDVNRLVREGVIRPKTERQGSWEWRNEPEDEKAGASLGFEAWTGSDSGFLQLRYTVTLVRVGENSRAAELMYFPIKLTTTRIPSNRVRWWFICRGKRNEPKKPVLILPNLGVQKKLQRMGFGKFICKHLIEEAQILYRERVAKGKPIAPLLGLLVHPNNCDAKSLYKSVGFSEYEYFHDDLDDGVRYEGMAKLLDCR